MSWLELDGYSWFASGFDDVFGQLGGSYVVLQGNEDFEPLVQYADDFEGFCRDVLGIDLWEKQIEIGNSVRDNPRTAVAACYSSGKTFVAAAISLWWVYTRRPALLVTTAPTGRQVRDLLWREIRKLIRKAKRRLPGRALQVRLILADDWQAQGFSSDKPNSTAGYHEAKNVLFIEDEAAGMDADVVAGYDGLTATEGSRHLKIGNPICSSGPFWDCFNNPAEEGRWNRIEISALETPNYLERRTVVPGLVTYEWVEDKREKWGESNPLWIMKVLGQFFTGSGQKVVSSEWVRLAQQRYEQRTSTWFEGPRILAADVAGAGQNENVVYLQTGRLLQFVDAWHEPDTMKTADRLADLAEDLEVQVLKVDATGLGKGISDRLFQLQNEGRLQGIEIVAVQFFERADEADVYARRLDEVQFAMRRAFDPANPNAVAIDPRDRQLASELPIRGWDMDRGRIKVETKRELKGRGVDSPDYADAVSVLFAPADTTWWS